MRVLAPLGEKIIVCEEMEMPDINVVVVGFGLAGRVFHAPFVSAVPGLRLAGIVQRSGDEAGKAYPEVSVLRSFEEALGLGSIWW